MNHHALAGFVSSRICHDLASPLGAIMTCLDLMREIGAADCGDELRMTDESARRATALLQLYRIAFCTGTSGSEMIGRPDLLRNAGVLANPPRLTLQWNGHDGDPLPRERAKLVALLLLCGRSVLKMRGSMLLETGGDDILPMRLEIDAAGEPREPERLDILKNGRLPEEMSPKLVEFVLASLAAEELGVTLSVRMQPTGATITGAAAT